MVTKYLGKGKTVLLGLAAGVFAVLLNTITAMPARAATTVDLEWVNPTTIRFSGSAVKSPINVNGNLVGNVFGTPPGSLTFMAVSNGPVEMTFGCKVSMTLDIFPDASSRLDFTKGELIFTTTSPSTCSQDTLRANINGLTSSPRGGTANLLLANTPISGVENRGPSGGDDTADKQSVLVTAGMGAASDYTGIPQTDTFTLCEAKGEYTNNLDALFADCLARKSAALSAPAITSNNLETLKNGKGPSGGDEKAWTGEFKNVKAGVYVVCSANFKACKLFTKNPGEVANVYVIYGSSAGSVIPGTPPGKGAPEEKVCTTGDGLAGALAWVLCPAVQLIASATSFFENNIIIPFMTVSPLTTHPDNPIYILWQNIRNVANVGFIIFFLIVIFSQATGMGIGNLGIKRILPRVAFVVGGVNLSYFIVAFVIDAFNIFGAGLSELIMAALQQAGTTQLNTGTSSGSVRSIFTLGGAALLAIVVSGGAAIGWFFSFLGLAVLVVVVVVIVLVVRQMAIIALVIAAPIPILLYLLPNTEGYFNQWRKVLWQLLLMYPMIVLLFAAGKIFGVILQQPDFKIAGEGVTDDVAQAVRVILQFVVYVVPLIFLPATFAASGALMNRAFGFLHNARTTGFARRGGSAINENFIRPRRQELQMRAARRGGAIGWVAGYGARRRFVREQRERELNRARSEYLANETLREGSSLADRAAGIGGEAGVTRAQAGAVSQLEKSRQEEIANEGAIFAAELRRLGISAKEFNSAFSNYVKGAQNNPNYTNEVVGTAIDPRTGQRARINFDQDSRTLRAALNAAAAAGEIGTIEAARMNGNVNQDMLDDVIRNNDGKLKEKGGYHLATNFNLAAGRMVQSDARGNALPGGAAINTQAGMRAEIDKQRLISIAQTSAGDIAGMKSSLLDAMQKSILRTDASGNLAINPATGDYEISAQGQALLASMDPSLRAQLRARLTDITSNQNLLGRAQNREAVTNTQRFI